MAIGQRASRMNKKVMKKILFIWAIGIITIMAGSAGASSPTGLSSVSIALNAQVAVACEEAQHGSFPSPITIDTQSASDQTFAASVDEKVACTNGTAFTIKVTSGNGTAVNQTCTSSGISSMALRSQSSPADAIAYTFVCAGDTDGQGHFTGAGFNTPKALGMSIRILAADAQAAVANNDYTDTITLTITY